jgi:hypothetical protein
MTRPTNPGPPWPELDDVLGPAVAAARAADAPAEALRYALDRIAARGMKRGPAGLDATVRRRLALLAAAAAALLVVGGFLLGVPPAAGAEVVAAMCMQAAPAVPPAAPGAGLRPLLLAHVLCILGGYAAFTLAWLLASLPPLLLLFNVRPPRFGRVAVSAALALLLASPVLQALGMALGAVWAHFARGSSWGWEEVEIEALLVLGTMAACVALARRLRGSGLLVAAVAAAGLWLIVALRWLTLIFTTHGYGPGAFPRLLAFTLCAALLNGVLLAAGRLLLRRAGP